MGETVQLPTRTCAGKTTISIPIAIFGKRVWFHAQEIDKPYPTDDPCDKHDGLETKMKGDIKFWGQQYVIKNLK